MLGNFLERRRLRRNLARVLDPRSVGDAVNGRLQRQPITQAYIEFVLCFVRGDTSENLSERIGAVVKIALAHEAIIHGTIGPLVATAYGAHPNSPAHFGARIALVKDLRRKLGDDIKIVHGATEGCYGLFGNESFMSYTFVVPEFNAALGLLSKLDFGQTEEV